MRAPALLFALLAFCICGAASWFGAKYAVASLEAETERSIASSLNAAGQNWAGVEADGLKVILTGTAPSENARFRSLEIAGQIVDTSRISDTIEVRTSTSEEAPEFNLRILRNGTDLSLIGIVPGKDARDTILRELLGTTTEARFTDLLEAVDYTPPELWKPALQYGVEVAATLPRSQILVTEGAVEVRAFLEDTATRNAQENRLIADAPSGVELTINLNAPKPVMTPYIFDATLNDTYRVAQCAAVTEGDADRILARLQDNGADANCAIALGAPTDQWTDAVIAGLDALDALGGGRITMTDTDVALLAPSDLTDDAFNAVVASLDTALPEIFSLTAAKPAPEPVAAPVPRASPPLVASLTADGVLTLSAPVADARAEEALKNYAASLFGKTNVDATVTRAERLPEGWSQHVLSALEALSYLNEAELSLSRNDISLSGSTEYEDAEARIIALLDQVYPQTPKTTSIAYTPPEAPVIDGEPVTAVVTPSPAECVRSLEILLQTDQIVFAPNSADITTESAVVLNDIADIITNCPDAVFEIGGHTDSQGRERMNLALSQSRAEAVLDALLLRNVRLRQLSARGYGESEPIADNSTEQGRAINRRIAFTLLVLAEDATEAETAAEDTPEETDQ